MRKPPYSTKQKKVNVRLDYGEPSLKHQAFHDAWKTPVRILCGAWGSGKTRSACAEILRHLLLNPAYIGKTALVVGLTAHHCRNQLLEQNFKVILSGAKSKSGKSQGMVEGRHYTIEYAPQLKIKFTNGSTILFASLEAKNNLAGYSVSMVFADELDKLPDEKIWALIQSRVRGESPYGFKIATCNSDAGQAHWLYTRYFGPQENEGVVQPGCYLDTLEIYDNKFLSEQDIQDAKDRCFGDPRLEQQYLLGKWVALDGMVFSEFDPKAHLYDPRNNDGSGGSFSIPLEWSRYAGADFGFGDATCFLWVAKSPNDGKYYIYREYYESGRTPIQNAEAVKRLNYRGEYIRKWLSDHYAETLQTYRQLGIPLQPADKGKGSIMQGVLLLKQLFFEDRLRISSKCVNLIRELLSYQWDRKTNEPKKNQSDHALDTLRYVMTDLEGKVEFAIAAPDATTVVKLEELQAPSSLPISTGRIEPREIPEGCFIFSYESDGTPIYARLA